MKKEKSILDNPQIKKDINTFIKSGVKIYLQFNGGISERLCGITGIEFRVNIPFAFYTGSAFVCPEVALEIGFTMDYRDWKKLDGFLYFLCKDEFEEKIAETTD